MEIILFLVLTKISDQAASTSLLGYIGIYYCILCCVKLETAWRISKESQFWELKNWENWGSNKTML